VLAAAPGRTGSRLYAIEGTPGLDERNPGIVSAPPTRWRLLGLDPITLAVVGAVPLDTLGSASATGDDAPPALAVTPDGNDVFVLFRGTGQRSALVAVDGTSGARRPPIFLPGEGLSGLAATDARVYVPDTLERGVWVVRRQTGRLLATVDVGRRPLGITVNPTS
jgi:DNA-binding beta-propeller fold protein YncE